MGVRKYGGSLKITFPCIAHMAFHILLIFGQGKVFQCEFLPLIYLKNLSTLDGNTQPIFIIYLIDRSVGIGSFIIRKLTSMRRSRSMNGTCIISAPYDF